MDCIFCKIVNKEIPGHIIYENEKVLAFLDISQATKGHTLIIPKKHFRNVFDITPQEITPIFEVVPMLANALKETFGAVGMNIENNNEAIAGQTVFHYHTHLIPRYGKKDGIEIRYANNMADYPAPVLQGLKEQILQIMEK